MVAERVLMQVGLRLIAVWIVVQHGLSNFYYLVGLLGDGKTSFQQALDTARPGMLMLGAALAVAGLLWWLAGTEPKKDAEASAPERSPGYQRIGMSLIGAYFVVNGLCSAAFHGVAAMQRRPEGAESIFSAGRPQDLAVCITQVILGGIMVIGLQRLRDFWSVAKTDSEEPR